MEEPSDERLVRFIAVGDEGREVASALEFHLVARAGHEETGGVDRLGLLFRAEAADGVEMLQRETERVDDGVAAFAIFRVCLQRHPFARAQIRMKLRGKWREGVGRLPQGHAKHVACEEHAAMNRRTRRGIGVVAQQQRMRQHADAFAGFQRHLLKRRVGGKIAAVELCQPTVQVKMLRQEQVTVVG
jgi:hypothetical protein